jgi:hypothetical protein
LLRSFVSKEELPKDYNFFPLNVKSLSLLLQYPTTLYEDKVKEIQEYLGQDFKKNDIILLIYSLQSFRGGEDYRKIQTTILDLYEKNAKFFRWSEIVRLASKASSLEIRAGKFWAKIL